MRHSRRRLRTRFWVESSAATAAAALFVLTVFYSDWIEIVFGTDPDHHSGSLELAIVLTSVVGSALLSLAARVEWRNSLRAA